MPLAELHCLQDVSHVLLEQFNLGDTVTTDVVNVGVDSGGLAVRDPVGTVHVSRDHSSGAVGVSEHGGRLNGLVLTVEDDLLPDGFRLISSLLATVEHDAIVVQLLDVGDGSECESGLPVVSSDESAGNLQERRLELVLQLDSRLSSFEHLRVSKAVVSLGGDPTFHYCLLINNYKPRKFIE